MMALVGFCGTTVYFVIMFLVMGSGDIELDVLAKVGVICLPLLVDLMLHIVSRAKEQSEINRDMSMKRFIKYHEDHMF